MTPREDEYASDHDMLTRVVVNQESQTAKIDRLIKVVVDGNGEASLLSRTRALEVQFADAIKRRDEQIGSIQVNCAAHAKESNDIRRGVTKSLWGIILAMTGFLAVQVYFHMMQSGQSPPRSATSYGQLSQERMDARSPDNMPAPKR